mgnify:CR=1 FL=1
MRRHPSLSSSDRVGYARGYSEPSVEAERLLVGSRWVERLSAGLEKEVGSDRRRAQRNQGHALNLPTMPYPPSCTILVSTGESVSRCTRGRRRRVRGVVGGVDVGCRESEQIGGAVFDDPAEPKTALEGEGGAEIESRVLAYNTKSFCKGAEK